MKKILVLFVVLVSFISCNCTKKAAAKNQVSDEKLFTGKSDLIFEYTANTRGFYQKITIQNQIFLVSKDRDGADQPVATKINDADWKELMTYFEAITLENLATFKDPTQKRFYDGAAIADLKITNKDKIYQSLSFDHGIPPVEIEKLVTKINSFTKQTNED